MADVKLPGILKDYAPNRPGEAVDAARNLAIDNGSGLTGCSACRDRKLQNICKFVEIDKTGYCMYIKFDDYCDNHDAQWDIKENPI
jgi:hypothetical protein